MIKDISIYHEETSALSNRLLPMPQATLIDYRDNSEHRQPKALLTDVLQ